MIICKNCGKELDDSSIFCTGCGKQLNAPEFPDGSAPDLTTAPEAPVTADEPIAETSAPAENAAVFDSLNAPTDDGETVLLSSDGPTADSFSPEPAILPADDNENTIDLSAAINAQQPDSDAAVPPPPVYGNDNGGFVQPPQYGQPAVQPVATEKEKKPVKVGAGRVFGASIVAFFALLLTIILSLALCVKFGANGKVLRGRVEKFKLRTLLTAEYDGDEISKDMYKTLGFRTATDGAADESSFKDFMLKSDFLEYAGARAEDYANYIIHGKGSDPSVTSEDLVNDFFKENKSAAKDAFGSELNANGYKVLQSNLEKETFDDTMNVKKWTSFNIRSLSYIFSYITIGIIFALIIVLFIWIAVIVDKKGKHLTGFYGNILLISGIIVFVIGAAVLIGTPVAYAFTSEIVFYIIANALLPFSLIALCAGFVEILFGSILKRVRKGIRRKEKKAKAAAKANA